MKIKFFVLLSTLLMALPGQSKVASTETYFQKISKTLRGVPPSFAERKAFQEAKSKNQEDAFVAAKIQEYLYVSDGAFRKKLKFKIDELYRVRTDVLLSLPSETISPGMARPESAYSSVIQEVLSKNLPWDQLFLLTKYEAYKGKQGVLIKYDDFDFFNALLGFQIAPESPEDFFSHPELFTMPQNAEKVYFEFDQNDPRVAGIITTPKFLNRYVNTALNKNRRRAAALFSTLLCDEMAPSVPPPSEEGHNSDFDVLLPGKDQTQTEDEIHQNIAADPHGSQADCMACHYKLDPMGQVFGLSSASMAPTPTPGALRYRGYDQRIVDIPVVGPGGLIRTMVQQPEYDLCQTKHFWSWYVGKDAPLSATQHQRLVQKFNEVGRRPKDFISYLIQLDVFKAPPVILNENQLLSRRVASIFKNCTACHFHQEEDLDLKTWDLAQFPYEGTAQSVKTKIRRIARVLDLNNGGQNKSMPPKESLWQPNDDDMMAIKQWIDRGAPDFEGNKQVKE